nr:TetR/AcrR family transcriptional regulator [Sneathiella chinensis]
MRCFWRQGYAATSMRDLERATELATGSLYNSFGNKEQLFERCFDFYLERVSLRRVRDFLEAEQARAGIMNYFRDALKRPAETRSMGCLLVNTACDLDNHSGRIAEKARQTQTLIEGALKDAILRAQQQGDVPADKNPAQLAGDLALILSGIILKLKTDPNTDWHENSLDLVARLLD